MKYAIKIHSEMTCNNFYFIGSGKEELKMYSSDVIHFFLDAIQCENASELIEMYTAENGLEYIDDCIDCIDENDMEIVARYSSRF